MKAVTKPDALHLEVAGDKIPLVIECDLVAVILERRSEQRRYELRCLGGASWINLYQLHHGVKRVEKKMGMELRAQCSQLCSHGISFDAGDTCPAFDRVSNAHDDGVQ